jgi:hypothetical protein
MKNFKWYLSFSVGVIILSTVYPWTLMFPIWLFGGMILNAFQISPYGFFIQPPEYIIRLVGLLIGLMCLAIILYLQRREMETQAI